MAGAGPTIVLCSVSSIPPRQLQQPATPQYAIRNTQYAIRNDTQCAMRNTQLHPQPIIQYAIPQIFTQSLYTVLALLGKMVEKTFLSKKTRRNTQLHLRLAVQYEIRNTQYAIAPTAGRPIRNTRYAIRNHTHRIMCVTQPFSEYAIRNGNLPQNSKYAGLSIRSVLCRGHVWVGVHLNGVNASLAAKRARAADVLPARPRAHGVGGWASLRSAPPRRRARAASYPVYCICTCK